MNAKEEFLRIANKNNILCAITYNCSYWSEEKTEDFILPINYTKEQYNHFLNQLDFDYYDGYGTQELYGTIWCKDGSWFERREYDGSEWWEHKQCPEIPQELLQ